jgi:hypothetical protein
MSTAAPTVVINIEDRAKAPIKKRTEEHKRWIEHKAEAKYLRFGKETMDLFKAEAKLRGEKRTSEITEEMHHARNIVRVFNDELEKKRATIMSTPPADSDDDADEGFNTSWQPISTSGRFKLTINIQLQPILE